MPGVVVTGASSGIGKATVAALIAKEFRVFAGVRRAADAEALRQEFGPRLTPLLFDVTDEAAVQAAALYVKQALGGKPLAGLVNNAGIAVAGPLLHLKPQDFRRQIETNLIGPFQVARAFVPLLIGDTRGHPPGRVVTVTSVAGRTAMPFNGAYSASKFGLEGMAEALRRELIVYGIKAIVVAPGPVRSEIWRKSEAADISALKGTAYERAGAIALARMRQAAAAALPAEAAGALIVKVLTVPHPRTRYLLTASAWSYRLLRLLPDALTDRLIARALGWR